MTETGTMTLTDFLLARIAEDEANALAAANYCPDDGPFVRWDTGRMMVECQAKRHILTEHESDLKWFSCRDDSGPHAYYGPPYEHAICRTLRAVVLPYAGHPDFREEWRWL